MLCFYGVPGVVIFPVKALFTKFKIYGSAVSCFQIMVDLYGYQSFHNTTDMSEMHITNPKKKMHIVVNIMNT